VWARGHGTSGSYCTSTRSSIKAKISPQKTLDTLGASSFAVPKFNYLPATNDITFRSNSGPAKHVLHPMKSQNRQLEGSALELTAFLPQLSTTFWTTHFGAILLVLLAACLLPSRVQLLISPSTFRPTNLDLRNTLGLPSSLPSLPPRRIRARLPWPRAFEFQPGEEIFSECGQSRHIERLSSMPSTCPSNRVSCNNSTSAYSLYRIEALYYTNPNRVEENLNKFPMRLQCVPDELHWHLEAIKILPELNRVEVCHLPSARLLWIDWHYGLL